MHHQGWTLPHDLFHGVVGYSTPGVVDDRLTPAHVAGIGFNLAQFEDIPVVDLASRDLLLARRERYDDGDALDIDDFHLFLPPGRWVGR